MEHALISLKWEKLACMLNIELKWDKKVKGAAQNQHKTYLSRLFFPVNTENTQDWLNLVIKPLPIIWLGTLSVHLVSPLTDSSKCNTSSRLNLPSQTPLNNALWMRLKIYYKWSNRCCATSGEPIRTFRLWTQPKSSALIFHISNRLLLCICYI